MTDFVHNTLVGAGQTPVQHNRTFSSLECGSHNILDRLEFAVAWEEEFAVTSLTAFWHDASEFADLLFKPVLDLIAEVQEMEPKGPACSTLQAMVAMIGAALDASDPGRIQDVLDGATAARSLFRRGTSPEERRADALEVQAIRLLKRLASTSATLHPG